MGEIIQGSCDSKLVVMGVPTHVTADKLYVHFQSKKASGEGDSVKSLVYPVLQKGKRAAVVEFQNEKTARSVLEKKMNLGGKFELEFSNFEPGLFESATVRVNHTLIGDEYKEQVKELFDRTGLEESDDNGEKTMKGDWYKIRFIVKELGKLLGISQPDETFVESPKDEKAATSPHIQASDEATKNEDQHDAPTANGQEQAGSEPAEVMETDDAKKNEITLDRDIFAYMQLTKKEVLDALLFKYKVTLSYAFNAIIADFSQDDVGNEGISVVQKLYQDVLDEAKQKNYKLPSNFDKADLPNIFSKVRRRYPWTQISLLEDTDDVLFIADSDVDCEDAIAEFKRYCEEPFSSRGTIGAPNYRSPAEDHVSYSRNDLFRYDFPTSKLVIRICQGDIAKQEADAIVNAANAGLHNGAGVTGAIFKAGGREFAKLCQDLIRKRGNDLDIGEVVHTDALGRLKCKYVLHVVGPKWHDLPYYKREENCQKIMNKLCWELIKYSNLTVGVASLALPAIGTGIYGVPMEVFCEAMSWSLHEFDKVISDGTKQTTVKEICLVNYDETEARELCSIMKKKLLHAN